MFREGDKVMQIRNNYDIMWKKGEISGAGIFNGDVGRILAINNHEQTVIVDFEDRVATYSFDMLIELEPAYAMTVHKAQGSEYKAVIFSAFKGASGLLSRPLLYTAVTRARDLLIIVGDNEIIRQMTENNRRQRRYSGLKIRLESGRD